MNPLAAPQAPRVLAAGVMHKLERKYFSIFDNMSNLLNRITINQEICHGKPAIRGLRYPVDTMLDLLGSGMTIEDILDDYKDLERQDLLACIQYAARIATVKSIFKTNP